ncbi:histidine protein methyltransferase 1 homolog [Oscarella lobularis]|uniref:histidine protein methyltransferase 1 homolog n=1 Tax=Oscarella lobularis TaxID=121494 RepID=UPI0033134AB7
MSEFKFSFFLDDDNAGLGSQQDKREHQSDSQLPKRHLACRIVSNTDKMSPDWNPRILSLSGGDISLRCVNLTAVESRLRESGNQLLLRTSAENSDLIPNFYEGGFKIWECSIDLIEHLLARGIEFGEKRVLDLGCGAGLPGIFALTKGAAEVHFQDYNTDVIHHVTIPNTIVNLPPETILAERCKFYAGDWQQMNVFLNPERLEAMKYDIILTSETIYNPDSYPALIQIFTDHLKLSGSIYVAAKTNYFGVGGSTHLFTEALSKTNSFCTESYQITTEGLSREIIRVRHKTLPS